MIRISKLADYAFVILAQMTQRPEENWSAATLAQETTLPLPTVAKLMKLLSRHGIVEAQRGATGGYRLRTQASDLSITRIIEAVDGPISLTECSNGTKAEKNPKAKPCAVQSNCPVRQSWERLNTAIRNALNDIHLSDIVVFEAPN